MMLETVSLLQECAAVTIASTPEDKLLMQDLGEHMGLSPVVDIARLPEVGERLAFFLVHNDVPDQAKMRLIAGVRAQAEPRRRYAPVICLVPRGPRHLIVPLVEMGFDEVLFHGDTESQMLDKLSRQLNRQLMYVQTATYFGPDRRRIETVKRNDPRRKYGGSSFRRFLVRRSPGGEIDVREQL